LSGDFYHFFSVFFIIQTREELLEYVVRLAMLPEAEPLPGFGRENMTELTAYFGQLATQKAIATFPKMREPAPRPVTPKIQTTCFADHVCKYFLFSLYSFIITI
jgi:hypothetical protein